MRSLPVLNCSLLFSVAAFEMSCAKIPDPTPAATEIRDGMKGVGDGLTALSKVDPLQLRRILDENADLRQQLDGLRLRLNGLGGGGGIVNVSSTNRLFCEVSGYSGALKLDAYVDSITPDTLFIGGALLNQKERSLPVTYDIAQAMTSSTAVRA